MATNGKRPPGRDFSAFKTDPEGRWKRLPEPYDCLEFRIKSMQLRDVQSWIMEETDRRERLNRNQSLSKWENVEVWRLAIGEKIITDWRGLTEGGKQVAFSRKLAREIMSEDVWCEVAGAIASAVMGQAQVETEESSAEGKASEPLSATASS